MCSWGYSMTQQMHFWEFIRLIDTTRAWVKSSLYKAVHCGIVWTRERYWTTQVPPNKEPAKEMMVRPHSRVPWSQRPKNVEALRAPIRKDLPGTWWMKGKIRYSENNRTPLLSREQNTHSAGSGAQDWPVSVQILDVPLNNSVILGKPHNPSPVPQYVHLRSGHNESTYLTGLLQ